VNPSTASIAQGTTQPFTATGIYSDGSKKDLTLTAQWSCLIPTIATVANSPTWGLATGVAPGSAVITASFGSVSSGALLNIKGSLNVTSLVVTPAVATIGFGQQQQFRAVATFSDNTKQDVTNVAQWSSTSPFITASSGLAIGQTPGTNTVFATFNANATATLTVNMSNLDSMFILPGSPAMANNTQIPVQAIGVFQDGSTSDLSALVNWSTVDPSIAFFANLNIIQSVGVGTTGIQASLGTLNASANLTVTNAQLQSIVVIPTNATIAPTTRLNMQGIGIFSDNSTQDLTANLTWSVANPGVASVVKKGTIEGSAPGPGSTQVNVKSLHILGSVPGSTQINVSAATVKSIALTPAIAFIPPGGNLTYLATGTFSDNSVQDLTYTASWSAIGTPVTVLKNLATGQGLGQAIVKARLGSVSGTAGFLGIPPQQVSLAITPAPVQIAAQTSAQLTAKGTFAGSNQDLTTVVNWTSSSPNVATVGSQTGIVQALAPGLTTITATLGSASTTVQVTVTNATLSSITVLPANPNIALGISQQFRATGTFSDGTNQVLLGATWTSSAPVTAVVDSSGLASSTGTGTTTMTATLNGVTGTTVLTVQ
jgi:hypothetical protein